MRDFLEKELGNYKKITIAEKDIPQAQLLFIDATTGQAGETVFPNYFPVSMLKEMLRDNGFILKKEDL